MISRILLFFLFPLVLTAQETQYVPPLPDDPLQIHSYTLANGLQVFLSVNEEAPRIYSSVAVRAGSAYDPPEVTGLAHYLEHMLFKGTSQYGTLDWEKEELVLNQIAEYYEELRATTDSAERSMIYKTIDSLSVEASYLAIPNAYDKMTSAMGAKGTNAYTSTDETVYINNIPSNELERWVVLESERFSELVLRLFHTEMETVYEEFNRAQDNDRRWAYQSVLKNLYPNHPYGTQTTIGTGEHLKNPSMVEIHKYFNTYYVPSNMAISLSGNLDPQKTITLIEKHFGAWPKQDNPPEIPERSVGKVKETKRDTVYGPNSELVYMGFAFDGAYTNDHLMVTLVDMLLTNGRAGLVDLNLVQGQKVLGAGSFVWEKKDFTTHFLYGIPREGQTLEEVEKLLLKQIEAIKQGDFSDALFQAVKNDLRMQRMKQAESNRSRAMQATQGFIYDVSRKEMLRWQQALEDVSREDIIAFTKAHFGKNYAVAYKMEGESNRHQVPKPPISKVHLNREDVSPFRKALMEQEVPEITPVFLDFERDLSYEEIGDIEFRYLPNNTNDLFELYYIFDVGSRNLPELQLAFRYFAYLGTEHLSAEEIKSEMYTLGVDYGVNVGEERSYIYLKGLSSGMEKAMRLIEEVLRNAKADKEAYIRLVQDISKARLDARKDKGQVLWRGLANYARYGQTNPYNDKLSIEALQEIDPQELIDEYIKPLSSVPHRAFYRGPLSQEEALNAIEQYHKTTDLTKDFPAAKTYEEALEEHAGQVFYVPYPMQQAELLLMRKSTSFNADLLPYILVFNEYFGSGLSSIVFQEIREQRGLAYAAFTGMSFPVDPKDGHLVRAYLGTQADKTEDAVAEMQRLLAKMPLVPGQFEAAKQSALKSIRTDWVRNSAIYWAFERARKRGIIEDLRKSAYRDIQDMTLADLESFFNEYVAGQDWVLVAIGPDSEALQEQLRSFGTVRTMALDALFP